MKIQGPNPYIHLYRTNQARAKAVQTSPERDDQLNISTKALQLQQNDLSTVRGEKIKAIKSQIEAGDYEIDYAKTAEKLVEFWRS